ncbi:hypothetical protein BPNPMPFG_005052 [Mesorhizobium sp. AR07]|uniref:HipA family kinase n=1 Tax=Mesorhizobium sp. AR07 TaxID=2865838 RepID=UPI00215FE68C|nr:HipA family kinase [Mesorhizobium sp. AR07]UVK43274.1 hypothetical protein BPNPMPFG_005052 [Mesorhizobium sp. AR07]
MQAFTSSASPIQVVTDVAPGFIKALNNPYGGAALIAELVAAELGTWLGLKVPPFAIIPECNIELVMRKNGQIMQGPLFFSMQVDGSPRDGTDIFLSKLRDRDDVAKLVIFDTWVKNWDRHGLADDNSDNLLFVRRGESRKYDLVPIDHAWAFDADFPIASPQIDAIEETTVYGKFPEFDPYITHRSVANSLARLAQLDGAFVEEVVNSVPPQWGLGQQASASLMELICRRAEYVVKTIAVRLVDDPPIPGLQS